MIISAIIVDDEAPARDELAFLLNEIENVEVVAQAKTAEEAISMALTVEHNAIFLDIQMPGLNGIEAAEQLQKLADHSPCITFVTAFDEYALPAFAVNAVDYILKPIDRNKLLRTVERIRSLLKAKDTSLVEKESGGLLKRIVAKKGNRWILVNVEDIYYVGAQDGEVFVQTYDQKFSVPTTLKDLEKRLPDQIFFRTHRGCLVNMNCVREISPFFSGTYIMHLDDKAGSEVQVSRTQAKKLKQLLAI